MPTVTIEHGHRPADRRLDSVSEIHFMDSEPVA
jgi:hypothetical protein